jgi:hypothetical protein
MTTTQRPAPCSPLRASAPLRESSAPSADSQLPAPSSGLLVTIADHDAGYKDLQVTCRNSALVWLRLHAPSRRNTRALGLRLQSDPDPSLIVDACRPELLDDVPPFVVPASAGARPPPPPPPPQGRPLQPPRPFTIDALTPPSADLVETVALILTYGVEFEKKMHDLARSQTPTSNPPSLTTVAPPSSSAASASLPEN